MVEHDRIAAVVSLSYAFAAVRGSGDGVLASKLSAEIERNLRILNPETEARAVLTDADALADLKGDPRPDNPSR